MLLHRIIMMISFNNIKHLVCNRSWIIIYPFSSLDISRKTNNLIECPKLYSEFQLTKSGGRSFVTLFSPLYVFRSTCGRSRTTDCQQIAALLISTNKGNNGWLYPAVQGKHELNIWQKSWIRKQILFYK